MKTILYKKRTTGIKHFFIIPQLVIISLTSQVLGQTWTSLGVGLNDISRTLLNDTINNRMIVGGDFTYAGGQSTPFIAIWNGTSWLPMGAGFNAPVHTLALFNNEIYAGGNFTMSGTDTVKYLAKWNGTNWVPIGQAVANGNVKFLKIYENKLYVSGDFTSYGNIAKRNITWNGTTFDSIAGLQYTSPITDIAFYKFKTYYACGGSLISSNGFTFQFISGSGSGTGAIYIKSLEVHQDMLYVSGHNTNPNSQFCADVYDGVNFQGYYMFNAVYPTDGPIHIMKSVGNDLYMGGAFLHSDYGVNDDLVTYNITRYNSPAQTFHEVNYGTDGEILDIELFKNSLYVVGDFVNAGSSTSNFISKLSCIITPTVTLSSFSSVCVNSAPITLNGGSPLGGIYTGTGVNSGIFSPVNSGTFQISYTYTDSSSGCSNTASKPIVVSNCGVGIEEISNTEMSIFPNPSNGLFTVTIQNNFSKSKLEIYNMLGAKIYQTTLNYTTTTEIDLSKEIKGIYFLKLIPDNSNKAITGKLIVQ